ARLLRTEGQLARAEISEGITRASVGLGLIVGGAVLLIPALVILLQAAVSALVENGVEQPVAAVIVGGATLVIGLILAFIGSRSLRAEKLVPNKTIQQLQRDVSVAKQQARHDEDERQRAALTRAR